MLLDIASLNYISLKNAVYICVNQLQIKKTIFKKNACDFFTDPVNSFI